MFVPRRINVSVAQDSSCSAAGDAGSMKASRRASPTSIFGFDSSFWESQNFNIPSADEEELLPPATITPTPAMAPMKEEVEDADLLYCAEQLFHGSDQMAESYLAPQQSYYPPTNGGGAAGDRNTNIKIEQDNQDVLSGDYDEDEDMMASFPMISLSRANSTDFMIKSLWEGQEEYQQQQQQQVGAMTNNNSSLSSLLLSSCGDMSAPHDESYHLLFTDETLPAKEEEENHNNEEDRNTSMMKTSVCMRVPTQMPPRLVEEEEAPSEEYHKFFNASPAEEEEVHSMEVEEEKDTAAVVVPDHQGSFSTPIVPPPIVPRSRGKEMLRNKLRTVLNGRRFPVKAPRRVSNTSTDSSASSSSSTRRRTARKSKSGSSAVVKKASSFRKLSLSDSAKKMKKKQQKNKKGVDTAEEEEKNTKSGSKNRRAGPPVFRRYQAESWTLKFRELQEFATTYGHAIVPHDYPPNQGLARWAKRQRYQYKLYHQQEAGNDDVGNSAMTAERIRLLDATGFCWDVHSALWNERFHELQEFKAEHGHVNVPSSLPSHKKLATWVKCQRRQYKLFKLNRPANINEERIELLNSVGFRWTML